ncbi:hypothetical protein GQ53DRAFT_830667 [Thozetella sp. PMI_491]|nr:hypothetical protein GQ53DRAFT_830667 [Thozetella sp. PMI_491]
MLSNRRSTMITPSNRASSFQITPLPAVSDPDTEPRSKAPSVITSTTTDIPGYRVVRAVGSVYGVTTRARKDTKSFIKAAIWGAEVRSLTHMLYQARDQATERMVMDCISRGGNAIIGLAFTETEAIGVVQISVQGTAVYAERA